MTMARQNLLVIGGGLTAAVTCSLISREPKLSEKLNVVLWDKARGVGGRMSTSRSTHDPNCIADLGAQFVTVSEEYGKKHGRFYDELVKEGVLEPFSSHLEGMKSFPEGTKQYVAPAGSSSIVKKFIRDAESSGNFTSKLGSHVSRLTVGSDKKWNVATLDGSEVSFEHVISTMPVPQVLQLQGDIVKLLEDQKLKQQLERVKYSSRYALGMFFDQGVKLPTSSWSGKFIYDNPVWRYASWENAKRNRISEAAALVLHTNIAYGADHVEKTTEEMKPILQEAARGIFPDLPEPSFVKCQKWRYSQVTESYPDSRGFEIVSEAPLLALAGDGFTHSHVDGCIESALNLVNWLQKKLL